MLLLIFLRDKNINNSLTNYMVTGNKNLVDLINLFFCTNRTFSRINYKNKVWYGRVTNHSCWFSLQALVVENMNIVYSNLCRPVKPTEGRAVEVKGCKYKGVDS